MISPRVTSSGLRDQLIGIFRGFRIADTDMAVSVDHLFAGQNPIGHHNFPHRVCDFVHVRPRPSFLASSYHGVGKAASRPWPYSALQSLTLNMGASYGQRFRRSLLERRHFSRRENLRTLSSRRLCGRTAGPLAIDLYNFVYRGDPAKYPEELVDEFPNSCGKFAWDAVEPTKKLFAACRTAGLPIIYLTGSVRKGRVGRRTGRPGTTWATT